MINSKDFEYSFFDKIKITALAAVLFGIMLGFLTSFVYGINGGILTGLLAGPSFGIPFGLLMFSFSNVLVKTSVYDTKVFNKFKLEIGETIYAAIPSNHSTKGSAIGGKILITNIGVRFIPHHMMGNSGDCINIPFDQISNVSIHRPSFPKGLLEAGLVKRMKIVTKRDESHYFVILKPEKLVKYLNEIIA